MFKRLNSVLCPLEYCVLLGIFGRCTYGSKYVIIASMQKQCKYCKGYFDELDFGVAKTTTKKVYRRRKCRHCYRKTKNILKQKRRKWIENYKEKAGCTKCGIKDPRVLDFHHLRDKKFAISDYYYYHFSLEKVQKEIKKCIVICANCHRVLHYENFRSGDYTGDTGV